MKKFVNSLSIFRIIASFAIIPALMYGLWWTTFVLFTLAALSDYADGWLARKYNATSKLGGVLDHIGDKLLVVNTMILLACMMPRWYIVVPVIIMIARELYVSGLREFAGSQKMEMPVPKPRFSMGKIKTAAQMCAIGAFLLWFAAPSLVSPASGRAMTYVMSLVLRYLPYVGIAGLWVSLTASLWSALEYTRAFAAKFKKLKK